MNSIKYCLTFPILLSAFSCTRDANEMNQKLNVLFISIDDLRPELGCYGSEYIKSPHIDRLAEKGTIFTNHFASVPTCGASRYSLLTGMLPRSLGDLSNDAIKNNLAGKPEEDIPETFIHHLRRNGYYTVGIGKISHYVDGLLYGYTNPVGTDYEMPHSWDEMLLDAGKWGTGWNAFFGYANGDNRQSLNRQVKPYEMAEVEDDGYPDGLITNQAIAKLAQLKKEKEPFFLAVGFLKPHLPFNAPKKYWDMYNEADIPISPNPNVPKNVHPESLHSSNEFNSYQLGEEIASLNEPLTEPYARKLRHAYFACVSYIDAQVGRLLNELAKQGLEENTIVVIWGDHGWHLGDHQVWGKHTIFDRALKSAFIVYVPGVANGSVISDVVSSVDIYPTIIELCKLNMPHETDGRSLVPMLENRNNNWENGAYSYFRNGISLRTERYRLTKYFRSAEPSIELFDHFTDPFETHNIAKERKLLVDSLIIRLEKGNTGLYNL
jgi:arylsulfatase A-like enzyme